MREHKGGRPKLSDEQVRTIRRLFKAGMSIRVIYEKHAREWPLPVDPEMAKSTIYHIANYINRTKVKD